ncbi:MAG: hypothetical protein KDD12_00090 [Lewinella sp.]|nr:hypothetical protein [Lewinella sp.]
MKTKIVLWGSNAQDERVLVALELRTQDNKVNVYVFPESIATEEFSQTMMNDWRNDTPMEWPEGYTQLERELSITESILPDDLKVDRGDLIQRAQTEWHFVVLSSKLYDAYKSELEEIKEKVSGLESFSEDRWNEIREFWNKVQDQVKEKNLFRDHANALRDATNEIFGQLKSLRSKMDEGFRKKSKENLESFLNTLQEIEQKVSDGLRLQPLFEDLKNLQRKFRDIDFIREHRTKAWEKLDATFKSVKERRFGGNDSGSGDDKSALERLNRRYEGLLSAIKKMEQSIQRDRDDLTFQGKKIERSEGQLEAQIRQAKILMIEERIRSKEEKLNEMERTKTDLERRLESAKQKEAKRQEREKLEEAKEKAKEKIAQEIKAAEEARSDQSEKLEKAAEALSGDGETEEKKPKEKGESTLSAIGTAIGESMEDLVDTLKAVASVVSDKIEDKVEDISEKLFPPDEQPQAPAEEEKVESVIETPSEPPADNLPKDEEE